MNRLAQETSPYLLQHRNNPVDWYSWGEEAFAAARQQNKPIFLSVGYSTCYWCHVMERQSFENEAIAAVMNELFINIKVDREERPDVDQLYMTAVQVLTRQGGWPMSVFLLPDLRPFYGGTYFPPTDGHGRPGFPTLLRALADAFHNRRGEVEKSAEQLTGILRQLAQPAAPAQPLQVDDLLIRSLIERSVTDYDPRDGGFGGAPKFPRETLLELLLVRNRLDPDPRQMAMLTRTLDAMAHGGIRDQLGGGFHRYSTDAQWLVPHFEIMLYDNAMLGWCYAEAFSQTHDPRYAAVARGIFDFVLREMTDGGGGFYTALDAEVDSQEGLNYLWTREEVRHTLAAALGDDADAGKKIDRFCQLYGLDDGPNFADPHHGNGRAEKNILRLPADSVTDLDSPLLDKDLAELRSILLAERKQRKQPLLDTKIITSWNALMIRGLARGGAVLRDSTYLDAAAKAARFLLDHHRTSSGALHRSSRGGQAKYAGFLDDYAFLAGALLILQGATGEARWKSEAESIVAVMLEQFGDPSAAGLFFSSKEDPSLIVRQKIASDSPLPSGNGVAAQALASLGDMERARAIVAAFAEPMEQSGESMSAMVQAALVIDWIEVFKGPTEANALAANDPPRFASLVQQAREIVQLSARWTDPRRLNVHAVIADGFHINAHRAALGMIATRLGAFMLGEVQRIAFEVDYPPPQLQQLGFAEQPIPLYVGEIDFTIRFAIEPAGEVRVVLGYQACDDRTCLPHVMQTIEVPALSE